MTTWEKRRTSNVRESICISLSAEIMQSDDGLATGTLATIRTLVILSMGKSQDSIQPRNQVIRCLNDVSCSRVSI